MSAEAALILGLIAVFAIYMLVDALFSYWTPEDEDEQNS